MYHANRVRVTEMCPRYVSVQHESAYISINPDSNTITPLSLIIYAVQLIPRIIMTPFRQSQYAKLPFIFSFSP